MCVRVRVRACACVCVCACEPIRVQAMDGQFKRKALFKNKKLVSKCCMLQALCCVLQALFCMLQVVENKRPRGRLERPAVHARGVLSSRYTYVGDLLECAKH